MTDINNIAEKVRDCLKAAGIKIADWPDGRYTSNLPGKVACVYPEQKWADAECVVAVFPDRVQRWQLNCPYNYSVWRPAGTAVLYETREQMVAAVQQLTQTPRAACW